MKAYRFLVSLLIVAAACFVGGCRQDKSSSAHAKKEKIMVAKRRNVVNWLNYKGVLEPLDASAIVSPVTGRVKKLNFVYGSRVVKGQLLMILNSKKLHDDFVQGLQAYLQKKSAFYLQKENFLGTNMLYKRGVIPRSQFLSSKNTYDTSELSLEQAKANLLKIMSVVGIDMNALSRVSLHNQQSVILKLKEKFDDIRVYSNATGVALFPIKTNTSSSGDASDSSGGKLAIGSAVKEGALLLSVGNLSGYQVDFKVNEIEVTKIKPGMMVAITGDGFPGITLQGKVQQVASQSSPDDAGGALSMYNVSVTVPHVDPILSKHIYVGMSCFLRLKTVFPNALLIPIGAIELTRDNKSQVTVVDKNGKRRPVVVTTGISTLTGSVSISSGIKQGDRVVVNND